MTTQPLPLGSKITDRVSSGPAIEAEIHGERSRYKGSCSSLFKSPYCQTSRMLCNIPASDIQDAKQFAKYLGRVECYVVPQHQSQLLMLVLVLSKTPAFEVSTVISGTPASQMSLVLSDTPIPEASIILSGTPTSQVSTAFGGSPASHVSLILSDTLAPQVSVMMCGTLSIQCMCITTF